eukprot:TRINITY_DN10642_c0_g1_i2.p1 TRINITY_DN10642_c0_g1~~TRINITY_DN10642_c0_g1_i2.p1  ORF type:complete len:150 (+),score=16.46 TRINITY_DN10642_c0_g1_i2:91-540(+)
MTVKNSTHNDKTATGHKRTGTNARKLHRAETYGGHYFDSSDDEDEPEITDEEHMEYMHNIMMQQQMKFLSIGVRDPWDDKLEKHMRKLEKVRGALRTHTLTKTHTRTRSRTLAHTHSRTLKKTHAQQTLTDAHACSHIRPSGCTRWAKL